jgi:NADPH:quinone reductase
VGSCAQPWVTRFGNPDVFAVTEQQDPPPGPGEVAVAVEVSDTLWVETQIRSGAGRDYWPMRPPYVPGNGVAGRVAAVGEGVGPALRGAAVVAHTGNEGGYADRAVVPVDAVSLVPDGMDLTVAAALLHDGPTALALFDVTKVGVDDAVVVVGASGGLGIASVQLARARAARVVAVARAAKLDRIRALRPDATIDSESADWVEQVRSALPDGGADVVLDNIGGALGEAALALVGRGGRFSGHGTPSGRFAAVDRDAAARDGITVTGIETVQMSSADLKRYTDRALREAAAGVLAPVIGQTFPLERVADAHAAIEARTVFGKTLLKTG